MLPSLLVALSAGLVGLLGTAHLVLTFQGPKLHPRDPALTEAMKSVHPVITRQTTMWKCWIGFNASHSLGALLFGATFSYLALAHADVFFGSVYLQVVGLFMLGGFVVLDKLYWFITPFAGSSLALLLYVAGLALAALGSGG